MTGGPRFNAETFPRHLAEHLPPKVRKECGIETEGEWMARMDAENERDLQKKCESYLRQHEIEFLHLSTRSREKAGWPDLTFAIQGRAHAVELKAKTGTLSDDQKKVLSRLDSNGWACYVVKSFEDFRDIIKTAKGE